MQRQLRAGHWYLVCDESGRGSIRAFMADGGWFPANPEPHTLICEMSRVIHQDNVIIGNDFTLTDWDRFYITDRYPAVAHDPQLVRTIRALAERLSIAAGYEWITNWMGEPDQAPQPDQPIPSRHIDYLRIACDLTQQCGGEHPVIQDRDATYAGGNSEGIFQPRRWPAEFIPGAIPLHPHA